MQFNRGPGARTPGVGVARVLRGESGGGLARIAASAPRRRSRRILAAFLPALLIIAAFASSASAALSTVGTSDPTAQDGVLHFPAWYADSTGLALQPCLDGLPLCLTAKSALVPPGGEGFYYAADATISTGDPAAPFDITVANHLEAAYAAAGTAQEVTFMRTQVTAQTPNTFVPNASYTVTDPYGQFTCVADGLGEVRNKQGSCRLQTPAAPVPLDFRSAMSGRIGPFLTWNTFGSAVGAPPAGYIGDNATPHAVVGSPTGFNMVRIEGPNVNHDATDACPEVAGADSDCVETNLFVVQGKVQPGKSAAISTSVLDFGNVAPTPAPAAQTVKYTNTGNADVTVSGVTLGGTNANDFSQSNNCTAVIPVGASCTITINFTPRANATSAATVTITDDTPAATKTISLKGQSVPSLSVDRTSIPFGDQPMGTTSLPQVIVVSNNGPVPATVSAVLGGASAGHYTPGTNQCATAVAPGGGCEVAVKFAPTSLGIKSATLTLTDSAGQPLNDNAGRKLTSPITLTGNGTPGDTVAPSVPTGLKSTGTTQTTVGLSWTASTDNTGVTGYRIFRDGTQVGTATGTTYTDTGLTANTTYSYTVAAVDAANNASAQSTTALVAKTAAVAAPTITTRSPASAATGVVATSNVTATFSEAVSGVSGTSFTLKDPSGAVVPAAVAPGTGNQWVLDPTANLAANTKYTVTLTGGAGGITSTASGTALTTTTWTFTTAAGTTTPAPTVTTRAPGLNGTSFAVANNITATFSKAVTGVSATTFTLKNATTGAAVAAVVTQNGTTNQWILNPNANLAADTKYTATLTGGTAAIRDAASGTPFVTTSWTFTTGPAPTMTLRSPGIGATGVSRTANATITFSEAVQNVTGTTFTLKNTATGALVTAVVSRNGTTNQWILNPGATLAANTQFTVTVTGGANGIRDLAGNPLATNPTWNFTTGAV